ncbi:MAG TPA: DUF5916 domain-containing protein [Acidobacteriota bacterium]|nr:DUF5916 domain-containing protein [Acidobacteriota bacterium]
METEAYLTYDGDKLYIAFVCHDEPETIRASLCERDKIFSDDYVMVGLDTYGDAAWAYLLYVNPLGIQGDVMWAATGGEERGFDLIWESAGIVTDSGYQVEIAIPFASLRFPNRDNRVWRLDFWRIHPRETQAEYAWAAYDRDENCWPCQWGTVSGIAGVSPGRGIQITPSVIAYQSGRVAGTGEVKSPYEFVNDNPDGELSVWGKYSISSSATLEAAVNPDFSQIEADAGQIDVTTTFTLFYPERRPFFQEGSDLFRAAIRTVYTRMINDPELVAKATLRSGRTSVGYLLARDRISPIVLPSEERSDYLLAGKSTSNVIRIRQSVGEGSEVGMIVTDQRFNGGGSGSSVTLDGLFRLAPTVRARYHLAASHVTEHDDPGLTGEIADSDSTFDKRYTRAMDGESFWGQFDYAYLGWWTSSWNASLAFEQAAPTFRQYLGFVPQNDYRAVNSVVGYFHRLPAGPFETINPHISLFGEWNFDGKPKYRMLELNLWTRLRVAQAGFFSQYARTAENFGGIQSDDSWHIYQDASAQLGNLLQLEAAVTCGHGIARRYLTMAKTLDLNLSVKLKPYDRILLQQWLDYARGLQLDSDEELYNGFIYRTRMDYQVSRRMAGRLAIQYDDFIDQWSIEPLLTYRLNPFSVFYIGSTYNYEELTRENTSGHISISNRLASRQFFVKMQYLLQI